MNEYYKIKIDKKYWHSKSGCCINSKDAATKLNTLLDVANTMCYFRVNNMYLDSEIRIIKIVESEMILDF